MTNPGQMVRTRARTGGRASVYEANAWCQQFTTGALSAATAVKANQPADMNISIGGSPANPAVIIATTASGYNIALDLVTTSLQQITAPADNKRKTAVVVYTDDITLKSEETDITGSPATCGLILVNGASSAEPAAPTEEEIRAAITEDGATGAQAAYAVIAEVTVSAGQMAITNEDIKNLKTSTITQLSPNIVTSQNIDWGTIDTFTKYSCARLNTHTVTNKEITSKSGLQYTIDNGVGRTQTKDGSATKIRYYKFSSVMHYDSSATRPRSVPAIGPFDGGGKVWVRVYAGESATSGVITAQEFASNGAPYIDLVGHPKKFGVNEKYTALIISYEAFWLKPGVWKIFGNLSTTATNLFLSFEAEVLGMQEKYCPSIYWRSLDQSNTNNCYFTFEFDDAIEQPLADA